MNNLQDLKFVRIVSPQAIVDNGSWTSQTVDTQGYTELCIVIFLGAIDVDMVALKVRSSETNNGSDWADVDGLDWSTDASELPQDGDDNKFFLNFLHLSGKPRYYQIVATGGDGSAGTYLTSFAVLSGGAESPFNATKRGAKEELFAA